MAVTVSSTWTLTPMSSSTKSFTSEIFDVSCSPHNCVNWILFPTRYLCNTYGQSLTEKVFFFVDNRNVIGKDIPFQLIHEKVFGAPMFYKSVVLAHDVDDFSKIWQAMGRSRTMNKTIFAIYKSGVVGPAIEANSRFVR